MSCFFVCCELFLVSCSVFYKHTFFSLVTLSLSTAFILQVPSFGQTFPNKVGPCQQYRYVGPQHQHKSTVYWR